MTPRPLEVLLLSKKDCGWCDQAKDLLGRLASEYPLTVATIDIHSSEGQELAERGGILFPPGIFLDGQPVSYGRPSARKLRREIEARLPKTPSPAC
ncbi:MAG: glutaredoxin family protein [Chloroflexota bacterium]